MHTPPHPTPDTTPTRPAAAPAGRTGRRRHGSRIGSTVTVTDLFCGAGGSSQGARAAGAEVRLAANHWKLAVDVHARNFPDTDHDCADISQTEPRRYPRTDVLLASPECVTHSIARTKAPTPDLFNPDGDPSVERSRATMWDVVRFAEIHRYEACIVENVAEVAKWLPFPAWLAAMDALGYDHHIVNLNSMVAPPSKAAMRAPQSRDRIYVVFWRKGNRRPDLDLRPRSWCARCGTVVDGVQTWKRADRARIGKHRQQYFYSCSTCRTEVHPLVAPAAAAIDWTLPCPLVGERRRPLAEATRRRIEIGIRQFATTPAPTPVTPTGRTLRRPGTTRTRDGSGVGPAAGVPHGVLWRGGDGSDVRDVVVPFIAEPRGSRSTETARSLLATLTAAGGGTPGLCVPGSFYVKHYGGAHQADQMVQPVTDPNGSITTVDSTSVVVPFLTSYYGQGGVTPTDHPVPTVTTKDRHALVETAGIVDDCGFRMLEPHEIQRVMAFADDYQLEGSKRDRVKLLGNAVTPPALGWLIGRVMESFGGDRLD